LGLIVAALTSLNRQLGFQEKWRHYRRTTELMRNEGYDFFAKAGEYKDVPSDEAFIKFVSTITTLRKQEVSTFIEEENNRNKESR
jgi:hypothetical protein